MIVDIKIKNLPVGIVTDSHTDTKNLEKLKDKYNQLVCLGDFTSVNRFIGNSNNRSIEAFRKSGIPCLRGNHEQCISNLKFAYNLSRENLDFINNLPIGFRLILPKGNTFLCFHNLPNQLGGSSKNPKDVVDLVRNYPIEYTTSAVLTGHTHHASINFFKELDVDFVRCASLKDGRYAEINKDGFVELRNLNSLLDDEDLWKKYASIIDAEVMSETNYPYYDEIEGKLIIP